MRKRQLKELTIKDNFMFGAVMADEKNCKRLLELTLGFSIEKVEISREKSILYHPEYKGVRLDIYAKGDCNARYNVEMQVVQKPELSRRLRYYHSQMDMEILSSGRSYTELPDVYVIFICDFDPFGKEKYRYTFEAQCLEEQELYLQDGCCSIFLSTHGKNRDEVPEELVKFLEFVKADTDESERDFSDGFVADLQETIRRIKGSRRMEEKFMLLEELIEDERAEAKAEGRAEGIAETVLELLEETGTVPEELKTSIMEEHDIAVLKRYCKIAAQADSIEQFLKEISK